MAAESWSARVSGRVTEAALGLRQPSRRFVGSVRSAVTLGAVIVGTYTLLIGTFYAWRPWHYRNVSALVQTSAGFSFITTIVDIALIFGMLIREDRVLKYIMCATMAVYLVCLPLCVCTFVGLAIFGFFDIPLWEIPRFGSCLLHLGLMYCLLAELRGDPLPPLTPTPPSPADGWLKNNLARASPPHTGDEALLKVHVENNNATPRAGGGPAVFAPSSCTTAAPVHPTPAATSGPPSTSDA